MDEADPDDREAWARADPLVLSPLLLEALGEGDRRDLGAHHTAEALVQAVLAPTLVAPLARRLEAATTSAQLESLHRQLAELVVLDPACGAGVFLVHALRALIAIEERVCARLGATPRVGLRNVCGLDIDPLAVATARVVLRLEAHDRLAPRGVLPLDVPRVIEADALAVDWPAADVIVGNPPFLARGRMQTVLGRPGLDALRERHPGISGHADYCVYFFRKAHDVLPPGGRAGMIGTDSIRQTHARAGGLDHIVATGGTLVEAAAGVPWPGTAGVRVAWVSWVRGEADQVPVLHTEGGARLEVARIRPSLRDEVDVGAARSLSVNRRPRRCFQGVTPGHAGFVFSREQAEALATEDPGSARFLAPYLRPEELMRDGVADRFVLDLHPEPLEAVAHTAAVRHLRATVLPTRRARAADEDRRNAAARQANPRARVNRHHANFLRRWWWPSYPRPALKEALAPLSRYLVCPRYGTSLVVVFVATEVRPSDDMQAFAFEDDYAFAILQSDVHERWWHARCSSLLHVPRYTSTTVFDAFPWPEVPPERVAAVAGSGRAYRELRDGLAEAHGGYRALAGVEDPGLAQARRDLDGSVRALYGLEPGEDPLEELLARNLDGRAAAPGQVST